MSEPSAESPLFARNVPGMTPVLQAATVAIAGCGGLGSNVAVALARAGVGRLILVDRDIVQESDLNRQHYFQADLGRPKVEALADHLRAINPRIRVEVHPLDLPPGKKVSLFHEANLLIEAFDDAAAKSELIESWCRAFPNRPIVCASGLGGFGRTDTLRVSNSGNIYICGDQESEQGLGLCSARVAIVANMQANVAIELLMGGNVDRS